MIKVVLRWMFCFPFQIPAFEGTQAGDDVDGAARGLC